MGFYLSPSVNYKETDLSTIVPAVATSIAAIGGKFQWGPCYERKLITNDFDLQNMFGKPNDYCAIDWFSASNFLKYGNTLYVVRAADETSTLNANIVAFDTTSILTSEVLTDAEDNYLPNLEAVSTYTPQFEGYTVLSVGASEAVTFVLGEEVTGGTSSATGTVAMIDDSNDKLYLRNVLGTFNGTDVLTGDASGSATATDTTVVTNDSMLIFAKYPGVFGNSIKVAICNETDWDTAEVYNGVAFKDVFNNVPADYSDFGTGFFGIVIMDTEDQILETFMVSQSVDAKNELGESLCAETYINRNSKYLNVFVNKSNSTEIKSFESTSLVGGADGAVSTDDIVKAYDLFANSEDFDVNIIIDGANNDKTVHQYIVDNICEIRRDCVGVLNVPYADVVGIDAGTATLNCVDYKTGPAELNRASSYAAIYGNWKYQFDKFNDTYRWLPISGDAAGIFALTDERRDPWFAPAGLNRGMVKNVVKLAFNPNRAQRDTLYKSQVNPIVSFPTDGPVIFGQKTLQAKPSAFDRIDVRRLFIVLEKAISTAARYFLFEKNTAFTRRQLVGMIEPFLRRVKAREGIYEFHVECSEINNTPAVIDANELLADIFIQPTRTAEFITLNFIATRTGVDFNEYIGKVSG